MIKEYLEEFRNGDDLNDYVIDYYIDNYKDCDIEDVLLEMENLMNYGCVSGMIPNLISCRNTNKFYDKYKDDINAIISRTGMSMEEIFGDQFDKEDPLILNITNKNLLAWFGFEFTSNQIYNKLYEQVKSNPYEYSY